MTNSMVTGETFVLMRAISLWLPFSFFVWIVMMPESRMALMLPYEFNKTCFAFLETVVGLPNGTRVRSKSLSGSIESLSDHIKWKNLSPQQTLCCFGLGLCGLKINRSLGLWLYVWNDENIAKSIEIFNCREKVERPRQKMISFWRILEHLSNNFRLKSGRSVELKNKR